MNINDGNIVSLLLVSWVWFKKTANNVRDCEIKHVCI